jgi:hypothetical protein
LECELRHITYLAALPAAKHRALECLRGRSNH